MSNRRFEVFEYRQVLARMRQGDSDRDIAGAHLMGRGKLKTVRQLALAHGWLDPGRPLPDGYLWARPQGTTQPHLDARAISRPGTWLVRRRRSGHDDPQCAETQPWLHGQLFGGAPYAAEPEGRARRQGDDDP
ncbi:hypothetical protein BN2475_1660002 [Paraburkholderia ribeironis]|uniref:Uncharacterized protein n=1 Tax=Paraburkholderia ribeironis TaxID=1247936 RepID=A0A1N7SQF3_9BURK|nr:hypothetical protein BN2475_1660002 [Paraburkholderia ribeironis]